MNFISGKYQQNLGLLLIRAITENSERIGKMKELKKRIVSERWAARYARLALGAAFLSAVASRFGLWSGQFNWNISENFIARTAELNAWAPRFLIPALAWSATLAETTFAVLLIAGVAVRWAAFGSAVLLFWFVTAMLAYTGLKPPLDYSVYSASACAPLLALHEQRRQRLKKFARRRRFNCLNYLSSRAQAFSRCSA